MKKITRTGLVVAVFLVACATGGAAARVMVPPAGAANVPRWDYLCFDEYGAGDVMAKAKEAGAAGWEMSGGNPFREYVTWCFKRPL